MGEDIRVLIVDDSQSMRMELREKYQSFGYDVVGEAENGLVALDLIKELSPDLVSLDIIMPEMDGIECYRLMRSMESPPRCLFVSALANEPRVIEAYRNEISVTHYVSKNISNEDLKNKISEVMNAPALPEPEQTEQRD